MKWIARRIAELVLHRVWVLGHDGDNYCRWCGLETRHIRMDRDAFTGADVYVPNWSCPVYWCGRRAVLLEAIRRAPTDVRAAERLAALRSAR